MVLGNHGRSVTKAIFTPVARVLYRMGVTPNMITYTSALLVTAISFGLIARGHLFVGGVLVGLVLFADSIDGILARMTGQSSKYGAFLDSTMDRITDGIVFGSLLWWAIVGLPEGTVRTVSIISGIVCMTAIGVVPYARARAENFGVIAKVGIAERTDRLIIGLAGAAFTDLGIPLWFYAVGLTWVAFASSVTVIQRMAVTQRELKDQSSQRTDEVEGKQAGDQEPTTS